MSAQPYTFGEPHPAAPIAAGDVVRIASMPRVTLAVNDVARRTDGQLLLTLSTGQRLLVRPDDVERVPQP